MSMGQGQDSLPEWSMERHLGKRFEDERLRRLIADLQDPDALRTLALEFLELKITQEASCFQMLFHWQNITPEQAEALLALPPKPRLDPFDNAS